MKKRAKTSNAHPASPRSPQLAKAQLPAAIGTVALIAAIMTLTLIAYAPVRHNAFIEYDDPQYLLENYAVRDGLTLKDIAWAFQSGQCSNWHPLTWISHMIDCQIFGVDTELAGIKSPGWHHLVSVAIHLVTSVILLIVLIKMTGSRGLSFFAAAAFALHPVHVESVAWAAERKDVLSGLFFVLTLACYLRYARKPGTLRYLATLFVFALGLMSKPMLVTLPLIVLLLDYWPLKRLLATRNNTTQSAAAISEPALPFDGPKFPFSRLVIEKIPFLLITAASSVTTYYVQKNGGAMEMGEVFPLWARIGNASLSTVKYLAKLAWPTDLAILYLHPGTEISLIAALAAAAAILIITITVFALRRRFPCLLFAWLWYLIMLIPVIGLVQVGLQGMADRYMYLPSVGLFAGLAWLFVPLARRSKPAFAAIAVFVIAVLIAWTAVTRNQVRYWKDSIALFDHAVTVTENNYICYNNYAQVLLAEGRIDDAITQLEKSLKAKPNWPGALLNLGTIYKTRGNFELAEKYYKKAIEERPDLFLVINNLAWLYAAARDEKFRNPAEALRLALQAEKISERRNPEVLDTLAAAYAAAADFDRAVETQKAAITLAEKYRRDDLIPSYKERLELFRSHKPFYE